MKSNDGAIYIDKNSVIFHPCHIIIALLLRIIPSNHVPQLIPRITVVQPYGGLAPPQQNLLLVQLADLYVRLTTEPILPMRKELNSATDVINDAIVL